MSGLRTPAGALVTFSLGAALMLALESTPARVAGVALLLAGIALGVLAIATDEFVAGDEDPPG